MLNLYAVFQKKGRLIKLTLILIFMLYMSACTTVGNSPLKIGMVSDHAPWEERISDTEAKGISVDMAEAFSKYTGQTYQIVWLEQDELYKSLSDKRIDCILSSAAISDSYSDTFLMSDPYTKSYPIMLIRKSSPVISKVQLNRETTSIAVISGTQTENFVKSEYSNAVIQTHPNRTSAVKTLINGTCDTFIDDPLSVFALYTLNPETTRLNPAPLTDKFQYYTVYATKDSESIINLWNEFFTQARKNKLFESLGEKHVKPFQPIMDQYNITITL